MDGNISASAYIVRRGERLHIATTGTFSTPVLRDTLLNVTGRGREDCFFPVINPVISNRGAMGGTEIEPPRKLRKKKPFGAPTNDY